MYADYDDYKSNGGTMSEEEYAVYGLRASDFLDWVTRHQLIDNLPSDETDLGKVKRACCAVADKLYEIDARKKELKANASGGGVLKSISSGGESMSFELSEVDKAILGGEKEINKLLYGIVRMYLSMVTDDDGRCYLYWGIG